MCKMLNFIVFGLFLMMFKGCTAGYYESKLITTLMSDYNKLARPVANHSDPVQVFFGLDLQQIIDVDEKNEMLLTNMWLNYVWFDYKLKWDPADYGGIMSIRLPSSDIWTPDILLYNSADEDIDSKFPTNIVVRNTGELNWAPLGLYISACSIDITWFPFDDQMCKMKFGSWTYDKAAIDLQPRDPPEIGLGTYSVSGEWKLIAVPAKYSLFKYDCCPEEYPDVTFTIHIRRRTLYFGFNLIIPCFLISTLALLTFVLPSDEGEKVGLGITVLLALSVFMLIVADSVPATSLAVPLLGMYFSVMMIMCTVSLVMTVVVLNFHHRNPDTHHLPKLVKTLVCDWLAWALRMKRPGQDLSFSGLVNKHVGGSRGSDLDKETKPPPISIISNLKDIDNAYGGDTYKPASERRSAYSQSHQGSTASENAFRTVLRSELSSILEEIRVITTKIREDGEADEETNDWKWAAMVIDRLCFWVFSAYLVIATIAVFIKAPHIFGDNDEIGLPP